MAKTPEKAFPLMEEEAWIWNDYQRLPGSLQLWPDRIQFIFQDFPRSHLKLEIFLGEIEEVDSFLVFNLSRLGLIIQNHDDRVDQFILDNAESFRKALLKRMENIR